MICSEGADLVVQMPLSLDIQSFRVDDRWHRYIVRRLPSGEGLLQKRTVYKFLEAHSSRSLRKVEVVELLDVCHFAEKCPRNVVQSNVGMITSPLSVPHSWATLTSDDCSMTVTISWRQSTFVFRYSRFTSPKHQLQLNLVWPVSRNNRVMFLGRPVSTCHIKYCIMHEFLFWPLQLSACKWTPQSPTP